MNPITVTKIMDFVTRILGLTHRGVKNIEDAFSTFDALVTKAEKGAAHIRDTQTANAATRAAAYSAYQATVERTATEDAALATQAARGAALVKKLYEITSL